MAWSKSKIAVVASAVVLLAAGLTFAMPFDTVQYTPPKVRLEMESAQCVFEGTLSNGKLSGVRIYKASPTPLAPERNRTN